MYLLYDKDYIIRIVSTKPVKSEGLGIISVPDDQNWNKQIYKKLPRKIAEQIGARVKKNHSELRIAVICNWKDKCGISTYSQFLVDSLRKQVKDIAIFSEHVEGGVDIQEKGMVRCWKRGEDVQELINLVKDYAPDFIVIQHEYGIFPNAFKFMQLMQAFDKIPYVVVMHSVYKHLDKAVYSESAKNIIVHTNEAKKTLKEIGNTSNTYIVPHGCISFKDTSELWNICTNPYTVLQFGFGFSYKGVDRALMAVAQLKSMEKKYQDMQYIYLCSTNSHNLAANAEYCKKLMILAKELDIEKNIVIIQKYQTEDMINLYLRLAKIAIFPYVVDPSNEVFGASGAIRIALANKRPVLASESHLFDDLEGVIPRPKNHIELANEISKIFNSKEHRDSIVENGYKFVQDNNWDVCAKKYLEVYDSIVSNTCEIQ